MTNLARVLGWVGVLAALALAGAARAQPVPSTQQLIEQQQERRIEQPGNNAPVWQEARSGRPQFSSVPGREMGVLIQSSGQTWRAARVPVVFGGGVLFALALAGLGAFYLLRGEMSAEHRAGDRYIRRFSPADRYAHWLVAIVWVTLAITGLIMSLGKSVLLPLIGYTLFSWLAILSKNVHNFIGPILIIGVPWLFLRFIRDNGIGADDFRWFANLTGYFKGHEHPSGRFNAGEKAVFWLVLTLGSTVLVVTGLILVFPNFDQTRATMQWANIIHMTVAYLAIALACVHIYLGTIGMEGAYRAMRHGYVTESWAKHHHLRWYEAVVANKAPQKVVRPEDVPPEAVPPDAVVAGSRRREAT